MALKVDFSGDTKQIVVKPGNTSIDVKIDIYSDWKEWVLLSDNAKYSSALRTFGGDPTVGGQFAPSYFFLTNGWRIVADNNEDVTVGLNLYTDEGDTPFIVGSGSSVTNQISDAATVDNGVEESLGYEDGIQVNTLIGVTGTDAPIGTKSQPVSNMTDAITIAVARGNDKIQIHGSVPFDVDVQDYKVVGGTISDVVILNGVNVSGTTFDGCKIGGSYNGNIIAKNCNLSDSLSGMNGTFINCGLEGDMYFNDNINTVFDDCSAMTYAFDSPSIYVGETNNLLFVKYTGSIDIYNTHSGSSVTLNMMAGHCNILSGNTGGDIIVRGMGLISDTSSGTTVTTLGNIVPSNVATQHSINVQTEILKNS
jgi:hypothetical protein